MNKAIKNRVNIAGMPKINSHWISLPHKKARQLKTERGEKSAESRRKREQRDLCATN
jgi:hypothetical protein